ncbi:MAG: polysaccharide biosynthesis/export family protein [Syntrophales bacterium]|jgi:polysaccharide export outer membrane protein|nr:polysaccharide biosynthesis/export family protein [Syntrophales bacterium]
MSIPISQNCSFFHKGVTDRKNVTGVFTDTNRPLCRYGKHRTVKGVFFCLALVLCVLLSRQTARAQGDYLIGREDVLEIIVWGHDDLTRIMPVSLEGMISFPLIGEVQAEGLSCTELEKNLAARLEEGFLVNPQLTVTVREYKSQRVFVMGEVTTPGTYAVTRENNILFVLSQAGGPTGNAGEEVIVIRPARPVAHGLTIEDAEKRHDRIFKINLKDALAGDKASNITICDGDSIIVPKMPFFFVMGEVKNPGKYNLERGTTVLMAISMGGGLTPKSAPRRTKITREQDGKKIEFKASMETRVLPGDTIVVPESFF